MKTLSRRRFLSSAALTLAATRLRAAKAATAPDLSATQATLTIPPEATGAALPDDFVGLSYEVRQMTDPHFFSTANAGLVAQFKALSTDGVLRLGGNTSEFGYWKPTPDSPEPAHPQTREVVGEPKADYYAVTAEAVRNLADFLEATGWRCIYGIGMGTNTPERAAAEGEFVSKTLGSRLEYFQIGNEVDLFARHLRDPKTWSPQTYLEEWLTMARAVAASVPGARFGMPDVAGRMEWLTEIAAAWPSVANPPHVTTLTHHHYFGGPATNPAVNIPNLLGAGEVAKVQHDADTANAAAAKMGVRVRMTEGNTCFRGGKPGLSDVFAAALWAADYALHLASNGYTGINLHGGTMTPIASGLGGFLPGDVLLKDEGATQEQIDSHPHPFYTPIAEFGAEYVMEPVGYGLKFAGALSGSTLVKADFTSALQAAGVNASAYAAKKPDGRMSVVVLNKDADKDLDLTLDFGSGRSGRAETETLHAPALESREAHIAPSADLHLRRGTCRVQVPHASGLRVTLL
jgi:hypothetical protein